MQVQVIATLSLVVSLSAIIAPAGEGPSDALRLRPIVLTGPTFCKDEYGSLMARVVLQVRLENTSTRTVVTQRGPWVYPMVEASGSLASMEKGQSEYHEELSIAERPVPISSLETLEPGMATTWTQVFALPVGRKSDVPAGAAVTSGRQFVRFVAMPGPLEGESPDKPYATTLRGSQVIRTALTSVPVEMTIPELGAPVPSCPSEER